MVSLHKGGCCDNQHRYPRTIHYDRRVRSSVRADLRPTPTILKGRTGTNLQTALQLTDIGETIRSCRRYRVFEEDRRDSMTSGIFHELAPRYWSKGIAAVPVILGTKRPAIPNWSGYSFNLPKAETRAIL